MPRKHESVLNLLVECSRWVSVLASGGGDKGKLLLIRLRGQGTEGREPGLAIKHSGAFWRKRRKGAALDRRRTKLADSKTDLMPSAKKLALFSVDSGMCIAA
jgi:hypothetical protein